jgi:hypothetical protein
MAGLADSLLESALARSDVKFISASSGEITLEKAIVDEGPGFEFKNPGYAASVFAKLDALGAEPRERDAVEFFSVLHNADCSYQIVRVERDGYGGVTLYLRLWRTA